MANVKAETVEKWIPLVYDHSSSTIYCTGHEKPMNKGNIKRHIEGVVVHKGTFKKPQKEFYFDFQFLCNFLGSQVKNIASKEFLQKYMCCNCCVRFIRPSFLDIKLIPSIKIRKMRNCRYH